MIHPSTPGAGDREGGEPLAKTLGGAARRVLTQCEWARRCGVSRERARQVLERGLVPGAIECVHGPKQVAHVIPEGTPWPIVKEEWLKKYLPPGYISAGDYAAKHGRNRATIATHFYQHKRFPEGTIRIKGRFAIPENAPWPYLEAGERGAPPPNPPASWLTEDPEARSAPEASSPKGPLPATPEVTP